jgi:hypothetical protein
MKRHFKWKAGQDIFQSGQDGPCWRVEEGLVLLDMSEPGGTGFTQLALPGDWLGAEFETEGTYAYRAHALVACVLSLDTQPDAATVWRQHHRRSREAMLLRTGSAPERLKQLLLSLPAVDASGGHRELPTLKDMAEIIDSAPETVSRILSHLRRASVLQHRQRQGAGFDRSELLNCVLPPGMTRSSLAATRAAPV